jgi:intracellular multiplication protein IcmK
VNKVSQLKKIILLCGITAPSFFCNYALAQQTPPTIPSAANALTAAPASPANALPPSAIQGNPPAANFQRVQPVSDANLGLTAPVPPLPPPTDVATTGNNANELDPAAVQAARDQAFNQLTTTALPMTPEQIQKLRNLFAESQRAATASPGGSPPKPVVSTQLVTLDPSAIPPIIRLSQGYVSSVVFLDSSGQPWPIQSYDIGNPSAFNIQWDHTSNILMVQSNALYTTGNLVVMLKGLNTPLSISLIPGQPFVDYRADLRVQGFGPNAKAGLQNALPQAASNDLLNILDGVALPNSKPLSIPGSNSQAWLVGDQIYLRTNLTLLSPAWIASMNSADGTNAYQIPKVPSILVADNTGKISNLRIEGY